MLNVANSAHETRYDGIDPNFVMTFPLRTEACVAENGHKTPYVSVNAEGISPSMLAKLLINVSFGSLYSHKVSCQ